MTASGCRHAILEPYANVQGNRIIDSREGRDDRKKGSFNLEYYSGLRASRFGLCPHQTDWPGPRDTIWTYRFIECCIAGAIPIQFRKTPLGTSFTKGIKFFWDDESHTHDDLSVKNNRLVALSRFTLCQNKYLEILHSMAT